MNNSMNQSKKIPNSPTSSSSFKLLEKNVKLLSPNRSHVYSKSKKLLNIQDPNNDNNNKFIQTILNDPTITNNHHNQHQHHHQHNQSHHYHSPQCTNITNLSPSNTTNNFNTNISNYINPEINPIINLNGNSFMHNDLHAHSHANTVKPDYNNETHQRQKLYSSLPNDIPIIIDDHEYLDRKETLKVFVKSTDLALAFGLRPGAKPILIGRGISLDHMNNLHRKMKSDLLNRLKQKKGVMYVNELWSARHYNKVLKISKLQKNRDDVTKLTYKTKQEKIQDIELLFKKRANVDDLAKIYDEMNNKFTNGQTCKDQSIYNKGGDHENNMKKPEDFSTQENLYTDNTESTKYPKTIDNSLFAKNLLHQSYNEYAKLKESLDKEDAKHSKSHFNNSNESVRLSTAETCRQIQTAAESTRNTEPRIQSPKPSTFLKSKNNSSTPGQDSNKKHVNNSNTYLMQKSDHLSKSSKKLPSPSLQLPVYKRRYSEAKSPKDLFGNLIKLIKKENLKRSNDEFEDDGIGNVEDNDDNQNNKQSIIKSYNNRYTQSQGQSRVRLQIQVDYGNYIDDNLNYDFKSSEIKKGNTNGNSNTNNNKSQLQQAQNLQLQQPQYVNSFSKIEFSPRTIIIDSIETPSPNKITLNTTQNQKHREEEAKNISNNDIKQITFNDSKQYKSNEYKIIKIRKCGHHNKQNTT